jgi:hypothetical protein
MTDTKLKPFDPAEHGFVYLPEHQPARGVRFYEYRNHPRADGSHDYYRTNIYLSQDGEFVTIWYGFLESFFVESRLLSHGLSEDVADGFVNQDEGLFRGYIESEEQAKHILKAFRFSRYIPQSLKFEPGASVAWDSA